MLCCAGIIIPAFALDFVADVVQFRGDASKTRWEFHYAFADTTVRYVSYATGYRGELYCTVKAVSSVGDTTIEEWIAQSESETSVIPHRKYLTGVRAMWLKPGTYSVSVVAFDLNDTTDRIESSFSSSVQAFGLAPVMSDVMFTQERRFGIDSAFLRNNVDAVPNPRHEIVGRDPSIGIYFEMYNAHINKLDTFTIELSILDNVRREMMTSYTKQVGFDDGLVIREDIPAGALRSGVYYLRVSAKSLDLATTIAQAEDRFYVLNPELPPEGQIYLSEEQHFLESEWSVMTGDRLKLELELLKVIATQAEKTTLAGCTDERAQQRFMYRFWLSRDPDLSTTANERLDEFRAMYQRAQKFYASAVTRDGWRTDRGRALMKYGKPTQIEQFIQTIDAKPYEIWFYQGLQGGAYFYFVDWQLLQNHQLVHSTVIGEIRNLNWYDQYAKAFSPNPNPEQSLTTPGR